MNVEHIDYTITQKEYWERYGANYDKVERLLTTADPLRMVEPVITKRTIKEELRNGGLIYGDVDTLRKAEQAAILDKHGVTPFLKTEEERDAYALEVAKLEYLSKHCVWGDLAAGLYTFVVYGNHYRDAEWIITQQFSTLIFLRAASIYKAAFGYAVNEKGRAIAPMKNYVQKCKEDLMKVLKQKEAPVTMQCVIPIRNANGKVVTKYTMIGKPLDVKTAYFNKNGTFAGAVLELNHDFFPTIRLNEDGQIIHKVNKNCPYLYNVAGSYVTFMAGRAKVADSVTGYLPETNTVRKMFLATQTAVKLSNHIEGLYNFTRQGRCNVAMRRNMIASIFPKLVNSNGYMSYTPAIDAIGKVGMITKEGLIQTGAYPEIIEKEGTEEEQVRMIATEKAAEFPEDKPKYVYVKLDKNK